MSIQFNNTEIKNAVFNDTTLDRIYYNNTKVWERISTWATGTVAEITELINADRAGTINLHDYWNVGDTRTVSSSAYGSIEMVLMDKTCNGFTWVDTPASGVTKPRFIVGCKGILGQVKITSNSSATLNTGGWPVQAAYTWSNSFYTALPTDFRKIFNEFTFQVQSDAETPSTLATSTSRFAFPPNYCVLGSDSAKSGEYENALYNQWEWYTTSENRIKSTAYWTSSLQNGHNYGWCGVNTSGDQFTDGLHAYHGASIFGCI